MTSKNISENELYRVLVAGAKMALIYEDARGKADEISIRACYLELAVNPSFE